MGLAYEELLTRLGRAQIDRNALLVDIERLEIFAVRGAKLVGPDMTRRITVGRLDLDHLRAQLGQEHGAVGPGAELLQRQHPHAL